MQHDGQFLFLFLTNTPDEDASGSHPVESDLVNPQSQFCDTEPFHAQ